MVSEEWGAAFDKLLNFYATEDLRSICKQYYYRKRSQNIKTIKIDELGKWMVPRLVPPIWKWLLGLLNSGFKRRYEEEKNAHRIASDSFYMKCEINKRMQSPSNFEKERLVKIDIIEFIIGELRKGDKEVNILKTI